MHWLRAKAQRDRSAEEVMLVTREMEWIVRFKHRARKWDDLIRETDTIRRPGHVCYAHRQKAMWNDVELKASYSFNLSLQEKPIPDIEF